MKLVDTKKLLCVTEGLLRTMHVVRADFSLLPKKDHIGTFIDYSDLMPLTEEFIQEMMASVIRYVYSTDEQQKIIGSLRSGGEDPAGAFEKLRSAARKKFRPSDVQGQFSELLLFNLLQHHFDAAPLLRKMPLTSNPEMERNGADAIHIAVRNGKYVLYLGEAKTYNRKKTTSLKNALNDSIDSICKSYRNHRNELSLYIFEDFVPQELESFARGYLDGSIKEGVEVHLVCLVAYGRQEKISGSSREELIRNSINALNAEGAAVGEDLIRDVPSELLPRINYVLFPVEEMDVLLDVFKKQLAI